MSNSSHDDSLLPSSRGRGDKDQTTEKRCSKCHETKPVEVFSKNKSKKDGLQSYCKACYAAYCAANSSVIHDHKVVYNAAHRDEIREYNGAYYIANRDEIIAHTSAYAATNRDAICAYKAAYYAANRDVHRAYKIAHYRLHRNRILSQKAAYYRANRDKFLAYNTAYRRANPDVYRASSQRRRARIKGNGGAGVSAAELRALRVTQNGFCAYCGLPWIAPLHIDHVIPIVQGGPHEISNIVLACYDCNSQKKGRTPEQWTDRWYYHRDLGV